ncbi:MAG: hypothetical protein GY940_46150 [bacterium]|nr:hypothetical protein [bacterium]
MKTKHRKLKLEFNKTTVADLDIREMKRAQGGVSRSPQDCLPSRLVLCEFSDNAPNYTACC